MAGIWIFSENVSVAKELVTLANTIAAGKEVNAVTTDAAVANEIAGVGVKRVVTLNNSSKWTDDVATPLGELLKAESAEVVLVGGTIVGKAVAGNIAIALDAGLVTDATKVEVAGSAVTTERVVYGGLAISTQETAFPAVITIAPHSYDLAPSGTAGMVETKEASNTSGVEVTSVDEIPHTGVDLSAAEKVVGFGRGVGAQEEISIINDLATAIGAEVGCSRPIAENTDWMPVEKYIGISGKQLKANLYVAVGVSGQIQHVSGIRDSKIIVAINNDENAPIFGSADYGIVGDFKEVVPALTNAIKNK